MIDWKQRATELLDEFDLCCRAKAKHDVVNIQLEEAMQKFKHGTLKSGISGTIVKNRKQAIAIGLSEARTGKKDPPSK